jgi:hypothetical protein
MYYRELNFPPIPEILLSEDFIPEIGTDDIGYGVKHFKNGEEVSPCSYWFSNIRSRELLSWIWKNVPATKNVSKLSYQQTHHRTGGVHIVHCDILRSYAINYMIDLGGEDAWTSWYKEKDKPLTRTKKEGDGQADTGYIDYANLELLDTVKFGQGKWYIIATNVLHDVDKIVGTRKSITISIPPHLEKRILENLLNDI